MIKGYKKKKEKESMQDNFYTNVQIHASILCLNARFRSILLACTVPNIPPVVNYLQVREEARVMRDSIGHLHLHLDIHF